VPAGERAKLKEEDDKAIAIDTFVAPDAIEPIYYSGKTLYLVPNGPAAQKPYAVLIEAMSSHDRFAIAQIIMSGRGQVAVVRPFAGLLVMTLLNFESQVKQPQAFADEVSDASVSGDERKLAASLLESATTDELEMSRYKDDYAAKLAKLIEKKSHGASKRVRAESGERPVMDLMDALRKSLSQQKGRASREAAKARGGRAPRRGRSPKRGAVRVAA